MLIALDYDETWTRDPMAWLTVVLMMKKAGHRVIGVTMRKPNEQGSMDENYLNFCNTVYFTSREAKRDYLQREYNLIPDVWIDDTPDFILMNAQD